MSTPFRSVLVPLDGTELAEQALPVGASLARRLAVPLHLVSVQEPVPVVLGAEAGFYGVDLEQDSRERLTRYIADIKDVTVRTQGLEVQARVIPGPVADALAEYIERQGIGLVVMTTHARKGLGRLALGSVADQLLRRIAVPALLLHPSEVPQPTRLRRFLVALGGERDGRVLDAVTALGTLERGPEYVLFHVVEPPIPVLTTLAASPSRVGQPHAERDPQEEACAYLERIAAPMRAEGCEVSWRLAGGRNVPEQVVEVADAAGADCIAIGTHGSVGVERLLTGSVADRVVRRGRLPVLVCPLGRG